MYFWDMVLLRLHFGFTIVPGGEAWVTQAMTGAYVPHWARLFTILPTSRGLYPQPLSPQSLWVLTQDCPPHTLLNRHAHFALQQFLAGPKGIGITPARLASDVAAAAPLDAALYVALARQRTPPCPPSVEAAVMDAVLPDHIRRMIDFRMRVALAASNVVNPIPPNRVLAEFLACWRQFWDRADYPPNFTPLAWFGLDVQQALMNWPGPSPTPMTTCPAWTNNIEWQFLLCAHKIPKLQDRLALLLLIYGGLNIRQINRLLRSFYNQSGWHWSESPADLRASLDHIVDIWLSVIRCMGKATGIPRRIGT